MPVARTLPVSAAVAKVGALLWGTGGLLALSGAALPHQGRMYVPGILGVGYFACGMALVLALAGHRLPRWGLRVAPLLATAAITTLVWFGRGETVAAAFAMLYAWVGLYAAYFLDRRDLYVVLALILAAHGFVIWIQPGRLTPAWHLSSGTVVIASVLVARLLDRLWSLARTDALTRLPDRRGFEEALPLELTRASRQGSHVSIAILDVDRFKRLNDRYGHEYGDDVLRKIARAWQTRLRETDLLSRWGGDEFVLVLPGADRGHAKRLLRRLQRAAPRGITVSVGMACWNGRESSEALIGRADLALYAAKERGRDRIVVAADPVAKGRRTSGPAPAADSVARHVEPIDLSDVRTLS